MVNNGGGMLFCNRSLLHLYWPQSVIAWPAIFSLYCHELASKRYKYPSSTANMQICILRVSAPSILSHCFYLIRLHKPRYAGKVLIVCSTCLSANRSKAFFLQMFMLFLYEAAYNYQYLQSVRQIIVSLEEHRQY